MKNYLLIFAILITSSLSLKADLGSSTTYFAKFYLKDGTRFTAYFEVSGYEPGTWLDEKGTNSYCSDEGFYSLLKEIYESPYPYYWSDGGVQDTSNLKDIVLYKNIRSMKPRGMGHQEVYHINSFGFVVPEDVVILDFENLEKTVFISAEFTKRNWIGIGMHITTPGMIDTIAQQQFWNHYFFSPNDDAMWGYLMLNYNEKINVAELERLTELKRKILDYNDFWTVFEKNNTYFLDEKDRNLWHKWGNELLEKRMQKLKEWFRKRGIFIIEIHSSC